MKGVKTVFVYTGTDLKLREDLVAKISKKLPAVAIADKIEDAEIIVSLSNDSQKFLATISTGPGGTLYPNYGSEQYGNGLVVKRGSERGTIRLLMSWQGSKSSGGGPLKRLVSTKSISTKFADAFIKAYLKANKP
jgi:hypothetical protein